MVLKPLNAETFERRRYLTLGLFLAQNPETEKKSPKTTFSFSYKSKYSVL